MTWRRSLILSAAGVIVGVPVGIRLGHALEAHKTGEPCQTCWPGSFGRTRRW
jgi:hypothetical protein